MAVAGLTPQSNPLSHIRLIPSLKHVEPIPAGWDQNILYDFEIFGEMLIILDIGKKESAAVLEEVKHSDEIISRFQLSGVILDVSQIIKQENLAES